MTTEGPDDWIKTVFAKAAADPVFLRMLLEDRGKALDAVGLSPAEKAILMAVPDEQIEKMVKSARKRPWRNVIRAGMFVGGVAAGLGLTGLVAAPLFATLGHTAELPRAVDAGSVLRQIAYAERAYRNEHGAYGSLQNLVASGFIVIPENAPYEYSVLVEGDTFTATARHRTRPDTRPAFQVGPDGVVKPLE